MTVRAVEGKQPYTGGTAIEIDENKVISLRLRDENNLIIYDAGDNEIYVDLQLPDELTPTDAFPVGITTGRVIVDNGWDLQGTLICAKTTSGDNIKVLYADEGTLWIDNGTGTFKQIYFKSDVDQIITTLTTYINGELAKKQNGVTSATAPTDPAEGDLWYDTTSNTLKVYNGSSWVATGGGGGSGDVVVSTDTGNELSTGVALWFGTESDYSSISTPDTNTLYIQYKSDGGGGFTPGVNTMLYLPLDGDVVDRSTYNRSFTVYGNSGSAGSPVFDTLANGKKVANFIASGSSSSNRFAFADDVTDIPSSGNLTVSFWMNWSGSTSYYEGIVDFRAEQGTDVYTWMTGIAQSGNKFLFHGSQAKVTTFVPTTGTWYNMVCVVDNGTCYVYKDGTQIYTSSYNYGNRASKICIGAYYSTISPSTLRYECFNGKLSDVIVENKAWTSQEVSDYFDLTKANYGIS